MNESPGISLKAWGSKALRSALCSASLLVLSHGAQAAGSVFNESFESGNTNQFVKQDFHNLCVVVQNSVDGRGAHGGTRMLECNWNGAVRFDDPEAQRALQLNSWNYSKEFLIRFWVRYAADVDKRPGNKLMRLKVGNSPDRYYFNAQPEQNGAPLFSFFESINGKQGPLTYGNGTPFGDGNWHKYEIYIKHNDDGQTNGAFRVWQDDKVIQQASNIVSVAPGGKWFPMIINSNWSNNPGWEHDANNHTYWDDMEIYSDNGTGAAGLMSDGSIGENGAVVAKTPNPPGDLTAR